MSAVLALLWSACSEPHAAAPVLTAAQAQATAPAPEAPEPPGRGFVVWESNRTGAWRLWIRDLDGSPPRRLSPEEGDRQHCCPHVSPDGERLVYLSLPRGQAGYPESGASGPMHLIDPDGAGDRVIAGEARTYFEHRAAVWRSASELIYIDAEGRTRLLDLETGDELLLTEHGEARHGWLINSRLTHATTGRPSFSTYDRGGRRVEPARVLGGCQPYFSHDGRWGIWVAGAGGPIRALELASRRTVEVLAKSDPRLPDGQGYLYFPVLSHDSTLLAVAASPDQHDHQTSNYDVFVAAVDPDTLEVLGDAWRVTSDPASDRFPDVYAQPLALGRHFGEAPLTVTLDATGGAGWQWSFGDGTEQTAGARVEHTFEGAGSYRTEASRAGEAPLRGFVRVRPARPPAVTGVAVRGGRVAPEARSSVEVVVRFDEAVDLEAADASFASGLVIERLEPGADGRSLVLALASAPGAFETLRLDGVRDRAQRSNAMPPAELEIAPPAWPADRRGLVFLWQSGDAANEVEEVPHLRAARPTHTGQPRACLLTPRGRAWVDRNHAMELAGGSFVADDASVIGVLEGCRRTNELTLEATLTPRDLVASGMARIVSFSSGLRSRNFTLGQEGDRLVLRLRTATTGQNADRPQLEIGRLDAGRPVHVLVSYSAGRLRAWLDGEQTLDSDAVQDGFFHWQPRPLVFCNEWQAERPWYGKLEAVAVYDRAFGDDQAHESHRRAARRLAERPPVPAIQLRATLAGRSRTPSLQEIAPYREALAVFEYRVDEVIEGDFAGFRQPASGGTPVIRVVHRVLADGEALPVSRRPEGRTYELEVESFFDQPQLESLYLANTLPERPGTPLYFSSAIEP